MFNEYMHLIDGKSERDTDAYVAENHPFEDFKERVLYFDNLGRNINNQIPKVVQLGMYELHCDDLILNLYRKTDSLRERVLQKMSHDHQGINNRLCERYKEISSVALTSPNNTAELVDLREKVAHIESNVLVELEQELNQAAKRLVFLSDFCQFTTSEMKLNTKTFQWHAKMPSIFDEHRNIIQGKTSEYQKALKLKRERFQEELDSYSNQVEEFFTYGNVDELPKYLKKAQGLKTKLEIAEEKIKHFNMEEKAFEWELTNYPTLGDTQEKLAPFVRLYEISMDFMDKQKTWFESPMGTHHPADIEKQVEDSLKTVSKLEKDFSDIPAAKTLVVDVRSKIEDFKDKMPIIKTLGNPSLRERHWELVSNTVGFPVKGGSETNLYKILDMGLDEYVKKFEKISETATKEHNLEKSMEFMVEEWSDKEFDITSYGETGTYTLAATDDIQSLLDDHIVKTQTMRGSPYIKPFEEQIAKWEEQLLMLQEIMDEWLKVQGTWLYFEPIFSSPDIMSQMPEEGRRFTTVDKNWRDIMKAAIVDKHVLAVLDIDRILEKLKKSSELLDLINKGLYDYLEKKRLFFPRFFFVSNAQLLEILSETKEPSRVARYLNKIFEGINALEFNDDQEITHIKSYTGEVISLTKNVSTAKARGQVDRWLADLDKQMKESLQKEFKMALSNYLDKSMRDWVDNLPSQIVTCGLQATWTAEIQKVSINCGSLWFYFLGWQQTTKISKSSDKFYFHCPNFSVEVHGFFFKYKG
jgi:dynein heavy chain